MFLRLINYNMQAYRTIDIDKNYDFLQKKTMEIKTALFKAEINSLLRLPNNIIRTLQADDDGYIWFFSSCNGTYGKLVDKSFYARLEYYQKSTNTYLKLNGNAHIAESFNELHPLLIMKSLGDNEVLIKFKITEAEYFGEKPVMAASFKETFKNIFLQFVYHQSYKQLDA